MIRTFILERDEDVSGISGTGRVAEGVPEVVERVRGAIRSVYDRHDQNAPLNHVNVEEWVGAVAEALAAQGQGGFWDSLGVDDGGMPVHLPMGVNDAGEGPENDSNAHHYVCWCPDVNCPLTNALILAARLAPREADDGLAERVRLGLREHAPLPGLPLFCSCGHRATTPYNRESHLVESLIGAPS